MKDINFELMPTVMLLATLLVLASLTKVSLAFDESPKWFTFDKFLDVLVSRLVGQKSQDSSGTPNYYKTFLLNDRTNERIATSAPQELLARSGYRYENHYVTSDDGYITNLIRIVNPMVNRNKLKQPPVMMMHGALVDSSVWLWSSSIQHHPEKYPRVAQDGPITSSNRSLAFVLANNGYDVWLVGTRGSNIQNKAHLRLENHLNWFDLQELPEDEKQRPLDYEENFDYWNYSMDDIGQFEVPRQQEKILQVTGSRKVTLIDFSQSTQIDLALMSDNGQFVSKLHSYVTLAPALSRRGTNLAWKLFHETACTRVPLRLAILVSQIILSPPVRGLLSMLNKFKQLRYSIVKTITRLVAGPSAKYETNLEPALIGHLFMPTGYKQLRHHCQQVLAGQLQKFHFGTAKNLRIYGSIEPPEYNLADIDFPPWLLVTGGNDILSTVSSNKQLLASVSRQPTRHVHIDHYNHLDLVGAVENDQYVNLPILDFLDEFVLAQ